MDIVIRREDKFSIPELLKGINKMGYEKRKRFLKGVNLDKSVHKNKVLLYGSANKLLDINLDEHQKATLISFYHKQIKLLKAV